MLVLQHQPRKPAASELPRVLGCGSDATRALRAVEYTPGARPSLEPRQDAAAKALGKLPVCSVHAGRAVRHRNAASHRWQLLYPLCPVRRW